MKPGIRASLLALAVTLAGSGTALAQAETAPDSVSLAELEAIYEARMDSARMRFSEADVAFMTGMIHHHAQALVMSGFAPTNEAGESVRVLAARIINAQKDEIATMERWLRDRGQPVPETDVEEPALEGHGAKHSTHAAHALMPGMLTPEQIRELEHARGAEFDRLFLTYMIQHHEGAVTMVHDLFATDGAAQDPATYKLASDVQVDQRSEIDRMERMLAAMTAEDADP